MDDYWHGHYADASGTHAGSPLKQVGKTVNGAEVGVEQLELIIGQISQALALSDQDTLIDLCCGNGLLTARLAGQVAQATGYDFTAGLLDVARQHYARDNLVYLQADILALTPEQFAPANRLSMYEALQHLSLEQFARLMRHLGGQRAGTRFFIGGVPDQQRLHDFYDNEAKFQFYLQREHEGRPHLGRWWQAGEIAAVAAQAGYRSIILAQPAQLYTAHYRFDVLLEKA